MDIREMIRHIREEWNDRQIGKDCFFTNAKWNEKGLRMNFDQVIVDPPRAGLMKHVMDTIIRMMPQYIAYVSCDPLTLARDVRQFWAAGYQLDRITPFDMFPQTYHVETVVLMSRAKS